MFLLLILIILFLCSATAYLTYKLLEIDKDLNTLYDNYAKQLEKMIKYSIELERCKIW